MFWKPGMRGPLARDNGNYGDRAGNLGFGNECLKARKQPLQRITFWLSNLSKVFPWNRPMALLAARVRIFL